jgi:hypothetical protein
LLGYTIVSLVYRGGNYEGPEEEEEGGPVEGKIHFRPEEDDKPGEFCSPKSKGYIQRKIPGTDSFMFVHMFLCLSVM